MKTRNSTAKWLPAYNRWQIKVTNDNGERRTFYSSTPGRKGQTECNRKADDWLRATTIDENRRCGDLIEQWLKDLEKRKTTSDLMRFLILERLDFFCKKCLELRTLSPKEDKQ